MNCDDCQSRIAEWTDSDRRFDRDPVVEKHLAGCPACRTFQNDWAVLDEQLTQVAGRAALPANFKSALFARLPLSGPNLSPEERAKRRDLCERQHRAALGALQRQYLVFDVATLLRISTRIAAATTLV